MRMPLCRAYWIWMVEDVFGMFLPAHIYSCPFFCRWRQKWWPNILICSFVAMYVCISVCMEEGLRLNDAQHVWFHWYVYSVHNQVVCINKWYNWTNSGDFRSYHILLTHQWKIGIISISLNNAETNGIFTISEIAICVELKWVIRIRMIANHISFHSNFSLQVSIKYLLRFRLAICCPFW